MQTAFLIMLFILGSCFGSFLCCQARRMHLKTTPSKKTKNATLGSRSVCLNCAHQLKWYENIPIISWLVLRGKCKNCHRKIGIAEFLSELGVGLAFLAIGTTIDITSGDFLTWAVFVLTLITLLPLSFLAIYDGIYGELPTTYAQWYSLFLKNALFIPQICSRQPLFTTQFYRLSSSEDYTYHYTRYHGVNG